MWAEEANDESWFGDLEDSSTKTNPKETDNAAPIIGEKTMNAIAEEQTILPVNALIAHTNDLEATEQQMTLPVNALIAHTNEEQPLHQFLADHGIETPPTIQINNQSASNDLNNAAAAAMATKVFQSLEELKKRDAIVHELQKQLQDAMQIIQQQAETTPHRTKFPSVRRRHKMKKKKTIKKTTFGGFSIQGTLPTKPKESKYHRRSPHTTLRHKFLKKDKSRILSKPWMTGKEKITSSKSKSANRTVAKDLKRKMKRISKYGRCKHNGARFRQQSSKVRQSK